MYPYGDQLLRWCAGDQGRKLGGLILEVEDDFCGQVRAMLNRSQRDADYGEVGIDTGACYNPRRPRQSPAPR